MQFEDICPSLDAFWSTFVVGGLSPGDVFEPADKLLCNSSSVPHGPCRPCQICWSPGLGNLINMFSPCWSNATVNYMVPRDNSAELMQPILTDKSSIFFVDDYICRVQSKLDAWTCNLVQLPLCNESLLVLRKTSLILPSNSLSVVLGPDSSSTAP